MAAPAISPTAPGRRAPGWRRRITYALGALAFCVLLYLALGALLAWNSMRPKRRSFTQTPAQYAFAYTDITFLSRDRTRLSGWYIPAAHRCPRGVIVLCHGIDGSRQSTLRHAPFLHAAGFAMVLFDFRARGQSGGRICTLGLREPEDLLAAVRWVEERPELKGLPIGVLGASLGASTAIMAAAREARILAVVAEAPFSQLDRAVDCNFQEICGGAAPFFALPTMWVGQAVLRKWGRDISPLREIAAISPRPVLIIEDAGDTLFPQRETRALYAAARSPKELWTVPDAGHCAASYVAPDEYHRRVTQFFTANLK